MTTPSHKLLIRRDSKELELLLSAKNHFSSIGGGGQYSRSSGPRSPGLCEWTFTVHWKLLARVAGVRITFSGCVMCPNWAKFSGRVCAF